MKYFILYALLLARSVPAMAALGAAPEPPQNTHFNAKAMAKVTTNNGYSVSENVEANGTTVREFVGADNNVFAVIWQGPNMPNLRKYLGNYAAQFVDAANLPHVGRSVAIHSDQLVLHSGGHIRFFSGSAYLPSMLPKNVSPRDLH